MLPGRDDAPGRASTASLDPTKRWPRHGPSRAPSTTLGGPGQSTIASGRSSRPSRRLTIRALGADHRPPRHDARRAAAGFGRLGVDELTPAGRVAANGLRSVARNSAPRLGSSTVTSRRYMRTVCRACQSDRSLPHLARAAAGICIGQHQRRKSRPAVSSVVGEVSVGKWPVRATARPTPWRSGEDDGLRIAR